MQLHGGNHNPQHIDRHTQINKSEEGGRCCNMCIYGTFMLSGLASIFTWAPYLFFFFLRDFGGDGRADWRAKWDASTLHCPPLYTQLPHTPGMAISFQSAANGKVILIYPVSLELPPSLHLPHTEPHTADGQHTAGCLRTPPGHWIPWQETVYALVYNPEKRLLFKLAASACIRLFFLVCPPWALSGKKTVDSWLWSKCFDMTSSIQSTAPFC